MSIINAMMFGTAGFDPSRFGEVGTGVDCLQGTGTSSHTSRTNTSASFSWTPTGYIVNTAVSTYPIVGYLDEAGNPLMTVNAGYSQVRYFGSTSYLYRYEGNAHIDVPKGTKGSAVYTFKNKEVKAVLAPGVSIPTRESLTSKSNVYSIRASGAITNLIIVNAHIDESGYLTIDEDVAFDVTSWYNAEGGNNTFGAVVVSLIISD